MICSFSMSDISSQRGLYTLGSFRCDIAFLIYVIGFEKRGHFVQNAIFCHFSTYHHFKAVRALGFRLGLLAVWTFYFTDPTLEP